MSALSTTTDPGAMPWPMKEKAYRELSGTVYSDASSINSLFCHRSWSGSHLRHLCFHKLCPDNNEHFLQVGHRMDSLCVGSLLALRRRRSRGIYCISHKSFLSHPGDFILLHVITEWRWGWCVDIIHGKSSRIKLNYFRRTWRGD